MADILQKIKNYKLEEIAAAKAALPLAEVEAIARAANPVRRFAKSLIGASSVVVATWSVQPVVVSVFRIALTAIVPNVVGFGTLASLTHSCAKPAAITRLEPKHYARGGGFTISWQPMLSAGVK